MTMINIYPNKEISMGRLGDWDKVEKKPRPIKFTRGDEIWEYTKLGIFILMSYLFFHFIIMDGLYEFSCFVRVFCFGLVYVLYYDDYKDFFKY